MNQMKAELNYDGVVILQLVDDLMADTERGMKGISLQDPYFNQLSSEKYALSQIRREIITHKESDAIDVLENFAVKMFKLKQSNSDSDVDYVLSIAMDTAQSILDSLYFE